MAFQWPFNGHFREDLPQRLLKGVWKVIKRDLKMTRKTVLNHIKGPLKGPKGPLRAQRAIKGIWKVFNRKDLKMTRKTFLNHIKRT